MSVDPSDRQKEFDEKNELGFPLLSDPTKRIAASFGVKRLGPLPVQRTTFVIDTDRIVRAIISSELKMEAHADEALEIVRSL